MSNVLPQYRAESERLQISDLVAYIIVQVRTGEINHAQIDERLTYVQWLLDHPGWQVNRPINEAA